MGEEGRGGEGTGGGLGLFGTMAAEFGGPATSLVRIVLTPTEGGTRFRLSDSEFRRVTEKTRATLDEGWRTLFGELKKHVEEGREG